MYLYYKIFGAARLAWHFLSLTVHVANSVLLYLIIIRLTSAAKIRYAAFAALGTALLFSVSPYNTEVIVHEPCFHYTLGFFLLLIILVLVQEFIHANKSKYAWWASLIFFLSSFSIEIFYVTPIFVFALALYYRYVIKSDGPLFRKIFFYFFIPELIIFIIHLALLFILTDHVVGHNLYFWIGNIHMNFLTKAPKYLFHILLLGRFFPLPVKEQVYDFFSSGTGVSVFCGMLVLYYLYIGICHRKISAKGWLTAMFATWTLLCVIIVCLLDFPDKQYVILDRYTYFMMPFIYVVVLLAIARLNNKVTRLSLFGAYLVVNIIFTVKMNIYWYLSSQITSNLVKTFPNTNDKKVLLLNVPENMNGIIMIGSQRSSAFKLMYDLESDHPLTVPVYDVVSYNMSTPFDGAHVIIINDSEIKVTLNQWGTWWWYNYQGAVSYSNSEYKLDMADVGHWYVLTVKHPASEYLFLYQVGSEWKVLDWNKKNIDQY